MSSVDSVIPKLIWVTERTATQVPASFRAIEHEASDGQSQHDLPGENWTFPKVTGKTDPSLT
jgi:hypothetical protein